MFDTIIKPKKTFVAANMRSYFNLGMFHKISIYLNVPPNKWDVDSKYVIVGFYANGESLIGHGDNEESLSKFLNRLINTYEGNNG